MPHFDIRSFKENMKTVPLEMAPFRIGFYQIAFLESGGGTVNSDGSDYELGTSTLFFNLPGQVIRWNVERNWRGYYCCIDESFYTLRPAGYGRLFDYPFFRGFTPGIKLQVGQAQRLQSALSQIDGEYRSAAAYRDRLIKGQVTGLLTLAQRYFEGQVVSRKAHRDYRRLSHRFKVLVHDYLQGTQLGTYGDNITPGGCARALHVSAKYLSETIRRDLGTTPTAYINDCLVEEAKKLLRATDLSVGRIASRLGFGSGAYFSRLFRRLTGRSPSEYRKSVN
jgi:AraC-like DNA-binding protein